jgi:argininosuccinate synthase
MLQALTDKSQENVEEVARLRLYKGSARVVGRKSPRSLYSPASMTPKASSNLTPRACTSLRVATGVHADTPQRSVTFTQRRGR